MRVDINPSVVFSVTRIPGESVFGDTHVSVRITIIIASEATLLHELARAFLWYIIIYIYI